jgi:threonine/homoserine/homoserine lactone efflux protein
MNLPDARQPVAAVPVNQSLFVQFRRGFITNLLNPKAALFFITVVPEFISGPAPSVRELAVLVSIYVAVATIVHGLIVLLAGTLQAFLAAPQRRKMAGNVTKTITELRGAATEHCGGGVG